MRNRCLVKILSVVLILLFFNGAGCANRGSSSEKHLLQSQGRLFNRQTWEMAHQVHRQIMTVAKIKAELILLVSAEPNAAAVLIEGEPVIQVNSAMLAVIGDNPDEFAFLMAHEGAHIARKHHLQQKEYESGMHRFGDLAILGIECIGMAFGIPLGLLSVFSVDSTTRLIALKYDRDQEREADGLAVQLMTEAGFDPRGALSFQKKLLEFDRGTRLQLLSTHPAGEERIAYLEELIE